MIEHRIRRGKIAARIALLGTLYWCGASAARAEAYIAVRTGLQCAACHLNHTGGGMRTPFGADYGLEKMPGYFAPIPEGTRAARGVITDFLSLGADLRVGNTSRFSQSENTNTFETREGLIYSDFQLLRDRLHLYADTRLAPGGTQSREIFALVENLPGRLYLKAGRFFPPYGLRLLDDEAFIRSRTGYTFQSPDDGLEIGWQPSRFAASLALTNGNGGAADDNTNKRISLVSSYAGRLGRIGASFSSNHQGDSSQLFAGLMAGFALKERFVALGEIDSGRTEDGLADDIVRQLIAYGEIDMLVAPGWNLKAAYDYHDPDTSQDEDEVDRITLGGEYVAMQFFQIRLFWRVTDRPPVVHDVTFEDDREVLLEIHLFL